MEASYDALRDGLHRIMAIVRAVSRMKAAFITLHVRRREDRRERIYESKTDHYIQSCPRRRYLEEKLLVYLGTNNTIMYNKQD